MTFLAIVALTSSALALAAGAGAVRLRARLRLAEAEAEAQRDDAWEAREREERTRAEGERLLAEARRQAEAGDRAKSRFLATMTHEMRTPLSGVIGTAELLLDTALAPDQRTYALAIKSSADAMLSLVDEILDLSRIEADRVPLQSAPFAIAPLVEGVAELLAPRAQAKGLDLAVHVCAQAPEEMLGDAARVRQILLNLAGNAVKFTTQGGVGLRVDAGPDAVRFSVLDTGIGFDPADAERLFGEFERSSDLAAEGVGLGLAISRKLASAMGGTLTAHATPGAGAAFVLELPRAKGQPAQAPAAERSLPLAGRKILVVSEAPFGGPWLAERLQDWGAAAVTLRNSHAVAQAVSRDGAEIVLIDRAAAARPADLAAEARAAGARNIVLLLTPAERGELPHLPEDGFDGYLVKPIRAASLLSRLIAPAGNQAEPKAELAQPASPPRQNRLRVLVAEDEPVNALIAFAKLTRLGHVVVQVADGEAACAAFESEPFDVALLDIRMPKLDGLAAARRMRSFEAASGRARALLVAVTADIAGQDRQAAIDAGMDEVLIKPLDSRALRTLLAEPARARVA